MIHQSTVLTNARGVELSSDGSFAQVGMIGNTCQLDVQTGLLGYDFDVIPNEEDFVLDLSEGQTLVIGENKNGLTVMKNNWMGETYTIDQTNVQNAAINGDAVVVVTGETSCSLKTFVNGQPTQDLSIPCQTKGLEVDGDTTYLMGDENLTVVRSGRISTLDYPSNFTSFNRTFGHIYFALNNSILATNKEGEQIWSLTLEKQIYSMDDSENTGDLIIMIGDSEQGEVVILDGSNGMIKKTFITPSDVGQIKVSNNGKTLAVILEDAVHFFKLSL
jgi:hypothetical protein